jgi:hypothetical protein
MYRLLGQLQSLEEGVPFPGYATAVTEGATESTQVAMSGHTTADCGFGHSERIYRILGVPHFSGADILPLVTSSTYSR